MKTIVAQYKDLKRWDVKNFLVNRFASNRYTLFSISNFLEQRKEVFDRSESPIMLSIHFGGATSERKKKAIKGQLFNAYAGDFVFSKIDARNGALCMVPERYEKVVFTSEFPVYKLKNDSSDRMLLEYLELVLLSPSFLKILNSLVSGASGRKRITPTQFENIEIPIPDIKMQQKIVADFHKTKAHAEKLLVQANETEIQIDEFLMSELSIEKTKQKKKNDVFIVSYKDLERWSVGYNLWSKQSQSKTFKTVNFDQKPELVTLLQRGKSPKYSDNNGNVVLNQKCNRWNYVDISHAKNVDKEWLSSIDNQLFLQKNDIIINSTGEGTIGRASIITKDGVGLFYDSHILLLRLCKNQVLPMFFVLVFNSNYGQSQVDLVKSAQSTKQTELGVDNLQKINFPLPPLKNQKTIISKIEKMKVDVQKLRDEAGSILQSAKDDLRKIIVSE